MELSDQSQNSSDSQIQQQHPQEHSLQDKDINNKDQNNEQQKGLSKKQKKKIMKRQKWQKQKLIKRQQKRQKQKQKKKLKKQLMSKQSGVQSLKVQKDEGQILLMKKRKDDYFVKMKQGLKVIIDLQFYDLMTQKQQNSLIKQLGYCHSVNRKHQKAFHYILTSATKQRQNVFATRYNADKWGIDMHEQSMLELFELEKLVYLTGDAEEEIEQFQADKIYIIGGIVDHNRLKKITYNYAIENKIVVKRLPMKNVHLKASVHLAVNHVWQWMLKKYNGFTWDESLKSVIPIRKLQLENAHQ